jgi:tetratricopeptide (TPR) repeat protein
LKRPFWARTLLFFLVLLPACTSAPDASELARDFYNLGNAYFDQGDYVKAGEMYTRALELDPSLAQGEYNWARALIESGEYDEALALLDRLLTQDPSESDSSQGEGLCPLSSGGHRARRSVTYQQYPGNRYLGIRELCLQPGHHPGG